MKQCGDNDMRLTDKGQHPLHQFPLSKSITSWQLPHCVANKSEKQQACNKSVSSWCGQKSVVSVVLETSSSAGKLRENMSNGFRT